MGRCPYLENVYRGVPITFMSDVTPLTCPCSVAQCDCIVDIATAMTGFRAWIPPINEGDVFTTLARHLSDDRNVIIDII